MIFSYIIGNKKNARKEEIIKRRIAIRAVILKDNKILMVKNNKGDCKFPGGGLEDGENYKDTLKREVKEETGYKVIKVKEYIGTIIERNQDEYKKEQVFEMESKYYICEVDDNKEEQKLDAYELELNFKPLWLKLSEAITINQQILNEIDKNPWVYRETIALKELEKFLNFESDSY